MEIDMRLVSKLYHKDVYMPEFSEEEFWGGISELHMTAHVLERCVEKRIPKPTIPVIRSGYIFEMGADKFGNVVKLCYRVKGKIWDYIYVVSSEGSVITTWRQHHKDLHVTLDESRYEKY